MKPIMTHNDRHVRWRTERVMYDMSLSERLRKARKARKMSLTDLSDQSGVSRGYLHIIERGDGNPSGEILQAIASALGVPVASLLGDAQVVCDDIAMMITPDELHLLQAIREQRHTDALRLMADMFARNEDAL